MKAKINVTVFQNGDVDILQASVYEELWKDYKAFKGRAQRPGGGYHSYHGGLRQNQQLLPDEGHRGQF